MNFISFEAMTTFQFVSLIASALSIFFTGAVFLRNRKLDVELHLRVVWTKGYYGSARIADVTVTEELLSQDKESVRCLGFEVVNKSAYPLTIDRLVFFRSTRSADFGKDIWKRINELQPTVIPFSIEERNEQLPPNASVVGVLPNFYEDTAETCNAIAVRFAHGKDYVRYLDESEMLLLRDRFFHFDFGSFFRK